MAATPGMQSFVPIRSDLQAHPGAIEQFPAKWTPVRAAKLRQNKNVELVSDLLDRKSALVLRALES
jgi:hypothetical protein